MGQNMSAAALGHPVKKKIALQETETKLHTATRVCVQGNDRGLKER